MVFRLNLQGKNFHEWIERSSTTLTEEDRGIHTIQREDEDLTLSTNKPGEAEL